MTTQTKSGILSTAGLTRIAILAAVGVALSMLEFPIFAGAPFYKLDPSGLAVMLAGFSMGFPAAAGSASWLTLSRCSLSLRRRHWSMPGKRPA